MKLSKGVLKDLMVVGRVLKPFGVEGYVRVLNFSGERTHLPRIREVLLVPGTKSVSSESSRSRVNVEITMDSECTNIHELADNGIAKKITIADWKLTNPLRCKFAGIDTPEDASTITNLEILVLRKFASPLEDDEYYLADLQDMQVIFDGEPRGKIVGVVTDAYAPLFEIVWRTNKKSYVPFIKEFFEKPDMLQNSIVLLREDIIED